jgi:RNA polymerase sigma-70 factor, ECF subfamily
MPMDWEKMLNEHGSALLLYARQWSNSRADAEEAVQEGFIRFWRAWQQGRVRTESPIGLLFTYVRRSALDQLRSGKRRSVREEKAAEVLYEEEPVFESNLDADEAQEGLTKALLELPKEQREVVIMKIWGDLTFREIATSLGIPPDTAASRYRYALKRLGETLEGSELSSRGHELEELLDRPEHSS